MVERLLEAELEDKLGYEPHSRAEKNLRIEETEKPVKRYKHHTVHWRYPLLGIEMENLNLR